MRQSHKLYIGGESRAVMRRFDVGVLGIGNLKD